MLKVFNTLTRQKEIFKSINPNVVNMYVCGPTVYNYIHIGNARSAIAFDTIRRYLEYKGYKVNYVSNFTDVDDKLIKAANEQHTTVPELADRYIAAFKEDTAAINTRLTLTSIFERVNLSIMVSYQINMSMSLKLAQVSIRMRQNLKKKRIQLTLRYGNLPSQTKSLGNHLGEQAGQVGTLSAQSCRLNTWALQSIFMVADKT